MAINTLTLSLSNEILAALQIEANAEHLSVERHINQILTRRVGRPHWSDVAETQALTAELERVTEERDRARDTAVLLENAGAMMAAHIEEALETGELVASLGFRIRLGLAPDPQGEAR